MCNNCYNRLTLKQNKTTLGRVVMRNQFVASLLKRLKETFVLSPSWLHYVALAQRTGRDISNTATFKVDELCLRPVSSSANIVALILLHSVSEYVRKKTLVFHPC